MTNDQMSKSLFGHLDFGFHLPAGRFELCLAAVGRSFDI